MSIESESAWRSYRDVFVRVREWLMPSDTAEVRLIVSAVCADRVGITGSDRLQTHWPDDLSVWVNMS